MYKKKILRLFTVSLIITLGLFTLITSVTLNSLWELNNSFINLSSSELPRISESSSLNRDVERLTALTTMLTISSSSPERRIAINQINDVILTANNRLLYASEENIFLKRQVVVLAQEIDELDSLIQTKIKINDLLVEQEEQIFQLVEDWTNYASANQDEYPFILRLLLYVSEVKQQNRIHKIRQFEKQITAQLDLLQQSVSMNSAFATELEDILMGTSGYIENKIESLRINGRARGRGNFVSNLVKDVANTIEAQSELISDQTLDEAASVAQKTKAVTNTNTVFVLVTTLISILIIYALYRQIVVRLVKLSKDVDLASRNEITEVSVDGDDEITKVADNVNTFISRVKQQESELIELSNKDPLTGIANRRYFEEQFQKVLDQSKRHSWCTSVLMIDIDYFKLYNDEYGHSEGDSCLRLVANCLNQIAARNTDICARYGGEEFICVLPDTDKQGAENRAREMIKSISMLHVQHVKSPHHYVTISIGIATFPFDKDSSWAPNMIIEQADKALYEAKSLGRNTFSAFSIERNQ